MGYCAARNAHETEAVEALVAGRFDWPEGLQWALGHRLYAVITLHPVYSDRDAIMGDAKELTGLFGTREAAEAQVSRLADRLCNWDNEVWFLVLPEAPPALVEPAPETDCPF